MHKDGVRRCIFIVGFMGSGKTTVGKLLANRIGASFLDTDEAIEERAGSPVPEIFRSRGEGAFREMERELLRELASHSAGGHSGERPPGGRHPRSAVVVATGGGLPCSDENLALMKTAGTIVYLRVGVDELLARVGDGAGRPLVERLGARGLLREEFGKLLAERERFYLRADVVVDNGSGTRPEEAVSSVLAAVKRSGG